MWVREEETCVSYLLLFLFIIFLPHCHICPRDRYYHLYFIVWKTEAQASGKSWITWMLHILPFPVLSPNFCHQYLACVARTLPYQDTSASSLDPSTFSSMAFSLFPSSTQDFLFLPVGVLASLSSFTCLVQPLKLSVITLHVLFCCQLDTS